MKQKKNRQEQFRTKEREKSSFPSGSRAFSRWPDTTKFGEFGGLISFTSDFRKKGFSPGDGWGDRDSPFWKFPLKKEEVEQKG